MVEYYTLDELREMHVAPSIFLDHMRATCLCGKPIIRNKTLTKAKCSNTRCAYHMAFRASRMFKYLGIKGFGEKTCKELIDSYGVWDHLELIGKVLDYKPELYLWEIAKLECIEGYDDQCETIFAGYKSFKDYFANRNVPEGLRKHALYLVRGEQYFKIKRPLSRNCIKIALHGSIPGFKNRDMVISYLNGTYGKLTRVVQKKNASTCDYVVTTDKYSGHRKIVDANKYGIPILSPIEFESELCDIIERHLKSGSISTEDMDAFLEDMDRKNL